MFGKRTGGFLGAGRKGDGNLPLTDSRALESIFNLQQLPSLAKELVHPGKDPKELLMRCIFKDERQRNAVVLYYAKCVEFGLREELEILATWLAGTVSVGGLGRRELVMTATGIISPQLWGIRDGKKKGFFGRKRDEETEQSE